MQSCSYHSQVHNLSLWVKTTCAHLHTWNMHKKWPTWFERNYTEGLQRHKVFHAYCTCNHVAIIAKCITSHHAWERPHVHTCIHETCSCSCTISLMQYTSVLWVMGNMKRYTGALLMRTINKSIVYIIISCLQACRVQCVRGEGVLTVVLICWLSPAWLNAPKLMPERRSDSRTMM